MVAYNHSCTIFISLKLFPCGVELILLQPLPCHRIQARFASKYRISAQFVCYYHILEIFRLHFLSNFCIIEDSDVQSIEYT